MKILALGGCGGMGRYAVKTLVELGACDLVILADLDEKRAASFARELGRSAAALSLDISDKKALKAAAADVDLVINTVGPFFRFGKLVLSSCIENGRDYIDICDDWEPTLDLLDLHPKARDAGITAVVGMGASPGISNLLAKKAIMQLDKVEEVFTGWDIEAAKPKKIYPRPSAATIHGIHQLTGKIKSFENGKFIDARPISPVALNYPEIGIRRGYTIGHPEAVTFPRYYPGLKRSQNVFTSSAVNLAGIKIFAWMVNNRLISVETAASLVEKLEGPADPKETPEKMLEAFTKAKNRKLPPLFAIATGEKQGRPANTACALLSAPLGGMGGATGVPLAVGAMLILRKQVSDKGVFAPEGIIDPDTFFNALAPLCTPPRKNADDLIMTTCSCKT